MDKKEKGSVISNLNSKINKLSKLAIVLICAVYALALGLIFGISITTQEYTSIPEYEHVYFNEDINSQISLIPVRTFDDEGKMTLKYTVRVYVYSRISSTSTSDPGYKIKNLKVSASTVKNIGSNNTEKMYYFTEYDSYITPVQHSYTIDNSSINQHPYAFYTQLQYRKKGKNYISTFKENVLLQPSATDVASMNTYFEANKTTENNSGIKFADKEGNSLGTLQFISNAKDEVYTTGTKITMNTFSSESRYHIDMQSWILTEENKYLPFVGVYSYSSQKSNYIQSGWDINKQLKPQYICSKLTYYFSETDYKEYYFKQDITKLVKEFASSPITGENTDTQEIYESNKTLLYIGIGTGIAIVGTFGIITCVYFIKTKKKNEDDTKIVTDAKDNTN